VILKSIRATVVGENKREEYYLKIQPSPKIIKKISSRDLLNIIEFITHDD